MRRKLTSINLAKTAYLIRHDDGRIEWGGFSQDLEAKKAIRLTRWKGWGK